MTLGDLETYSESYTDFLEHAEDEVGWLIPGLLAPKDKLGIVAPPKTGKTYLVLHLLHALACGHPPLGREDLCPDEPVRCLLIEAEGNKVLFARRLKKVAAGLPEKTAVVAQPIEIRFRRPFKFHARVCGRPHR